MGRSQRAAAAAAALEHKKALMICREAKKKPTEIFPEQTYFKTIPLFDKCCIKNSLNPHPPGEIEISFSSNFRPLLMARRRECLLEKRNKMGSGRRKSPDLKLCFFCVGWRSFGRERHDSFFILGPAAIEREFSKSENCYSSFFKRIPSAIPPPLLLRSRQAWH